MKDFGALCTKSNKKAAAEKIGGCLPGLALGCDQVVGTLRASADTRRAW